MKESSYRLILEQNLKSYFQVFTKNEIIFINLAIRFTDDLCKTSKDSIDKAVEHKLEPIGKEHYDKARRVVRELFKLSFGVVICKVHGSLHILRKEGKYIPEIVQTMRDTGNVSSPVRVRVAC